MAHLIPTSQVGQTVARDVTSGRREELQSVEQLGGYALANQDTYRGWGEHHFKVKAASVGVPYMSPINATDYSHGCQGFIELRFTATQTTTN
jgi:hypothetical protein